LGTPVTEKVGCIRVCVCHGVFLLLLSANICNLEATKRGKICMRAIPVQEIEEEENEVYKYAVASMQGWRTEMVLPLPQ
jgi:hypothetical protein